MNYHLANVFIAVLVVCAVPFFGVINNNPVSSQLRAITDISERAKRSFVDYLCNSLSAYSINNMMQILDEALRS
jgi:hypothetical protein